MNRLYNVFIFMALSVLSGESLAAEPDWLSYDQFLHEHVKPGYRQQVNLMTVDYIAIKNSPKFAGIVSQVENFNTNNLTSREERLAFYINAYNVLAIKVVLDNWPVNSIKDVGSLFSPVWKKDAGKINHKITTLHIVEHEILRKMSDPRIHMAIVCASISCPDLRNEAYTAARINQQLDDQSKLFLQNSEKGLYIKGNTAHVSKIFDWFEEDFKQTGGVKSFIRQYRKDISSRIDIDADIDYNWNLNKP